MTWEGKRRYLSEKVNLEKGGVRPGFIMRGPNWEIKRK